LISSWTIFSRSITHFGGVVVGTIDKDIFNYSSPCSLLVLICPSSRDCRSFGSVLDRILELRRVHFGQYLLLCINCRMEVTSWKLKTHDTKRIEATVKRPVVPRFQSFLYHHLLNGIIITCWVYQVTHPVTLKFSV
jgi:hypothetical protein